MATSNPTPVLDRCRISDPRALISGLMTARLRMFDSYEHMLLPTERSLGRRFLWVVYLRPDLIFLNKLPTLASLAAAHPAGGGPTDDPQHGASMGSARRLMFISNWHKSFDPSGKLAVRHGFSDHFFIVTREAAHAAFVAPLEHICAGAKPKPVLRNKLHPEAATWAAIKAANVTIIHHSEIVPVVVRYWGGVECFRLTAFAPQLRSCCEHARKYERQLASHVHVDDEAWRAERKHANGVCTRVRARWGEALANGTVGQPVG